VARLGLALALEIIGPVSWLGFGLVDLRLRLVGAELGLQLVVWVRVNIRFSRARIRLMFWVIWVMVKISRVVISG